MSVLSKKEKKRVLKEFATTKDYAKRNQLAVILSDDNVLEMIPVTMNLLLDDSTKKHRGTLVYSLSKFQIECFSSSDIDIIVGVANDPDEGFEAKLMAEMFLEDME